MKRKKEKERKEKVPIKKYLLCHIVTQKEAREEGSFPRSYNF